MSSMKTILINLLCLALCLINSVCDSRICMNKSDGFYTDYTSSNCRKYYLCRNETRSRTLLCSKSSAPIFSAYRQRCIAKHPSYDECHVSNISENSDNCAFFSVQLSTRINETYHYSCLYPLLFDLETKECKHYSKVQCHQRFEPKDACDYYHPRMYRTAHEIPCWVTPSCRDKTDGFHGNRLHECSSYYHCQNERLIKSITCPRHMRFSNKSQTCLPTLFNCDNSTVV